MGPGRSLAKLLSVPLSSVTEIADHALPALQEWPGPPPCRLIIFDASALVSAALKVDSVPERALLRAEEVDVFALSPAVEKEIVEVFNRPRFVQAIRQERREYVLGILRDEAVWFEPAVRVADCRDPKDDKYLELALAAGAETICQRRRRPSRTSALAGCAHSTSR